MNQLDNFKMLRDEPLELPEYIDKPEYVRRKGAGYGLMAVGWLLWMWLFAPLLTGLLWWLEGQVVYAQVMGQSQPMTSISLMKLSFGIGVLIVCLLAWASYNWARFHRAERRRPLDNATEEELAQSFAVELRDIVQMRRAKSITLHYSDEGLLQNYAVNLPQKMRA